MSINEKLEWIIKATDVELLIQFESTIRQMSSDILPVKIEANADYAMIKKELMNRLDK